ncbi:MAG: SUMF1/EgtB/PvdO family nonheme iron enzyme [Treponema sp.]|nr:SUMF1/EgtB/PvdO family nonheme iron enzyme [Treponema sp.]
MRGKKAAARQAVKTGAKGASSGKDFAQEDIVRLKPFLGMRPGVYLAAIYATAIVAVIFFALFFPGVARPGAPVAFSSEPSGAALRVDGAYMATSPARVFVPAGARAIEVALPGFEPFVAELAIPRRAFGSRPFSRAYRLDVALVAPDPLRPLALAAEEYALWSFGGEASDVWQTPRSLSEGAYRAGSGLSREDSAGIVAAASRFAGSRSALRDLVRAASLSDSGGASPSPLGLASTVAGIAAFLDSSPAAAPWLSGLLQGEALAALESSPWSARQAEIIGGLDALESLAPSPTARVEVGGLGFVGIDGGQIAPGGFGAIESVDSFFFAATQVSQAFFDEFLRENPFWRRDNLDELVARELATDDYLADFGILSPGGGWSTPGVNAISWHAADAFCRWLSAFLPAELAGWEVRLPTEAEWEFAARSARSGANFGGVSAPGGGSWEWCAEPFSPLPFFPAPDWAIAAVGSPERPLRGGSWLHASGESSLSTRGFLPPAACSPFVSFRPVIARAKGDS